LCGRWECKFISITCSGNVTEETCNLFNRLRRTLPPGPDPVHLFAENFDVEMWNSDRIMELDGKFRNKSFCCIFEKSIIPKLSFLFCYPISLSEWEIAPLKSPKDFRHKYYNFLPFL
jgi:hypothetical protein